MKTVKIVDVILITVMFVMCFLTFQYIFKGVGDSGFYQNVIAALIGTLLTIIITSFLLRQQAKSDELKEQNVGVFTKKVDIMLKSKILISCQFTLTFLFFLLSSNVSVRADELNDTYLEIVELEKQLEANKKTVAKKIAEQRAANPLYAEKSPFESDADYLNRMTEVMTVIQQLEKQYIGDIQDKISRLYRSTFPTSDITVTLGEYDANNETWPITIKAKLKDKFKTYQTSFNIAKKDAEGVYRNWSKVVKTGYLCIDPGYRRELALVKLENPINRKEYVIELPIVYDLKNTYEYNDDDTISFSMDGKHFAAITGNGLTIWKVLDGSVLNQIEVYNIKNIAFSPNGTHLAISHRTQSVLRMYRNFSEIWSVSTGQWTPHVAFSPDGKYVREGKKIREVSTGKEVPGSIDDITWVGTSNISPDGRFHTDGKYLYRKVELTEIGEIKQAAPSYPPDLLASVSFSEPSGNRFLDANETAQATITIQNRGRGTAVGVRVAMSPATINGLSYNDGYIEEIRPNSKQTVKIPIQAYLDIPSKKHILTFNFSEKNAFPPQPIQLQFSTKAYVKPKLVVVDVGIDEPSGNGRIEPAEVVSLTVRVQNQGQGVAKQVTAKVVAGKNTFIAGDSSVVERIGDLPAGQSQDFSFEAFTNRQATEMPIYLDLVEVSGLADLKKHRLPIELNKPVRPIRKTVVSGQGTANKRITAAEKLTIDIERNIPLAAKANPNAVAVVIGISDYQNPQVPSVDYAKRDAQFMREYLIKSFGYDPQNILPRNLNEPMTAGTLKTLIRSRLPSFIKSGRSDVFVYFTGHGAPSTSSDPEAFLVPYDCDPNFVNTDNAYLLQNFYEDLGKLSSRSITVVLDTCFSGLSGSGQSLVRQVSPLVLPSLQTNRNPLMQQANALVITSTSNDRVSNWYPDKNHSLFTYFFLKGLQGQADQNNDRQITVNELENYLMDEDDGVIYWSNRLFQRPQTPQLEAKNKAAVIVDLQISD